MSEPVAVVYHILPVLLIIGVMYLLYGLYGPRMS